MAITEFGIVRRSMTARMFSTVTTTLMVGVAVAMLLVLWSMRSSAQSAYERGTGNMHLMVSRDASPLVSVLNGIFYANAPRRSIDWSEYQRLSRAFPYEYAIPTQLGDSYRGRPVLATQPEFFDRFQPAAGSPWAFAEGEAFDAVDEIVVGSDAAGVLGLAIGDEISLTHGIGEEGHAHDEFIHTIVGILEPSGTIHDRALFTSLETSWVLHAHDRRLAELGPDASITTEADILESDKKITGIYLRLPSRGGSTGPPAALPQVFSMLRADPTITVANPGEQIRQLFAIVGNVDLVLQGMAGVVLVAGAAGIMLALWNSMEQRRRQIAVLRVLGASRGTVFSLVLTESAILGLLGTALGVVLAIIGGEIVANVMKSTLGLVVEPTLVPRDVVVIAAGAVVLAMIAGIAPAISGYRTSVMRNLRPIA